MLMDRQLGARTPVPDAAGIAGVGRLIMELSQFIEDMLNQENGLLQEAVDDLTAEELVWQPGAESNPIGWTLWHMLRVEDMWVQFFAQRQTEIWERDGWHEKFGLPTRDNGFNHTPQQVAEFPALEFGTLLEYGEAVRAGTLEYLRGLSPEGTGGDALGGPAQHLVAQPAGGGDVPPVDWGVLPTPGADCLFEGVAAGVWSITRGVCDAQQLTMARPELGEDMPAVAC